MAKYLKKKKKRFGVYIPVVLLLLLASAIICIVLLPGKRTQGDGGTEESIYGTETSAGETEVLHQVTEAQPVELSDGLKILHIGGYAGIYMEDGTDEVVSDVMMLVLENTSDKDLQLARICMEYSDFTAEFEVTNIPAGEMVVALEKNRHKTITEDCQSIQANNVVFFPETMSIREDLLKITGTNGYLEVTNISGEEIAGDIFIYYKNSAADLLYGGITYRVRVEGGLAAGETRKLIAGHYTENGSRLVLADCGE